MHAMSEVEVPLSEDGSRRYPHAPIAEAVLELRIEPRASVTVEELATVCADDPEFTVGKPLTEITGTLSVDDDRVSTESRREVAGHIWHTADERRHVQARRDVFLYAQRAPYRDWETFIGDAERFWLQYKEIVKPLRLTRLGVRYVNRIDIPLPNVELTEYLLTTAQVPPDLPQLISGYLLHIVLPNVSPGVPCQIISTLLPPSAPDTTSLILDIDVWANPSLDPNADDFDQGVRTCLGELRRAKNNVFEACITDKTRRLFL